MENCPKCQFKSYSKVPKGQIKRDPGGFTIANEYQYQCLKCGYKAEVIRENTRLGNHFSLPWYKRIFNI